MQNEFLGEGERYQLQDPIGRGGMATIYRGRDMRMERIVAIKVLREVYSTDPKFVTRFQREAKAASSLQHPNIVQVYDYGQTNGNYFIVMELVEGTDLRRYLRSRGVLAIDRAIIIAHDVALGLGAAHRRGIVHRDVKPQNVLVGRDGSIKLTDFGIASVYKDINAERLTTTGMTLGTVQYYAPEQAQGEIVSPAADVYALGIVMYEMLTGRPPFDGDTPVAVAMQHIQDMPIPPSQLNPNIPQALEDIIMRCLEKVPEMRYRDGSTLARALEVLGEEELGENIPSVNTPGGLHSLPSNQAFNLIPQRPSGSPRNDAHVPSRSLSSPNNMVGTPPYPAGQQEMVANGSARADQNYSAAIGDIRAGSSFNQNQGYVVPPLDLGTGSTRPFRSNAVQNQRDSRWASIVTVLILIATLLLLGFSVYLAGVLGFIPLPGLRTAPTVDTTQGSVVPNLLHLSYSDAVRIAGKSGFNVVISKGPQAGVVLSQSLQPGEKAQTNVPIQVDMGLVVPSGLAGKPLKNVEKTLSDAGLQYSLQSAGTDPTNTAADIVQRVDPAENSVIDPAKNVTIFVTNCTLCANSTPIATPTKTPLPKPTPTATPTPGVTPTVTPGATPTVTPGVTPTVTPGATPIPTLPIH